MTRETNISGHAPAEQQLAGQIVVVLGGSTGTGWKRHAGPERRARSSS